MYFSFFQLGDFGLEALVVLYGDVLAEGEELAGAFLVLVFFPAESDSDSFGDVPNALAPEVLVQLGVHSHVLYKLVGDIWRGLEQ